MIRNRELNFAAAAWVIISLAGAFICWAFDYRAGIAALGMALCLGISYFILTLRRYRALKRMAQYLARVYGGAPPLDIRDNREGELSILKNDLYKVTVTLYEQAEQLSRDKKFLADTLSDISHQLKTPLTSISVIAELIRNESMPHAKRMEFLTSMDIQLRRVEWLVESLLKLARIDADAIRFEIKPIKIRRLIEMACAPLIIAAELKEQELIIDCAHELIWAGDLKWTAEALTNVIKNCTEHTPNGGRILIRCEENALHTLITVSDTGGGAPPEDIPHIFERFYRGKNAAEGSVGVGLAMSRAILHSQNADISFRNGAHGAVFTIKLYKKASM